MKLVAKLNIDLKRTATDDIVDVTGFGDIEIFQKMMAVAIAKLCQVEGMNPAVFLLHVVSHMDKAEAMALTQAQVMEVDKTTIEEVVKKLKKEDKHNEREL